MGIKLPKGYRPSADEPFMNDMQKEYVRQKLLAWREELLRDSEETLDNLKEGGMTVPDISDRASAEADRMAVNTVIQGSAAEIVKKAMLSVSSAIKEKGLRTKLLLQIHDELIFEVPEDEKEEAKQLIKELMENAEKLSVPLHVSIEEGQCWGAMH